MKDEKQMKPIQMVPLIHLIPPGCADDMVAAPAEAGQKEIFSSWALFILIMLLILALFTSYILQSKKIQAVHETVISIIAGR
jgi:solute carrier family 9 (sodium/hydrogen exchanger), member 6/7